MVAVRKMVASVEADVEAAAEIPATLKPVGPSSRSPSSPGFLFSTSQPLRPGDHTEKWVKSA